MDAKISTSEKLNITSNSATIVGFIVAQGGGFSEKGVCYHTAPNPTPDNQKVVYTGEGTTATFSVTLTGLNFATKYYARAYAIGAAGVIYGEEYEFTTLPILPTVTSVTASEIKGTSAVTGGEVTATGGAEVTARGVVFGESPNPTIAGSKTVDGEGLGEFVSNLTGLKGLTKYYVRAYATNSAGTAYGEQIEFTTLVSIRKWFVPGNYVEASYPGSALINWDPANSPFVMSSPANPNLLEGYVYMAQPLNEWKFATQPNWDGPNYGVGDPGTLDPSGANVVSPAGYYKITADAEKMTYTTLATIWGVVGSATPGSWDNDTPLTYDPTSATWQGGVTLTANEFKFRANDNWDYNYGSTAGNATLDAGGTNIPVAIAADYYIILDLSKPHEYTYSANRWGVIGSATPGGWGTDTDMTWDPVTKSMTVTLNLVAGDMKFRANDDWAINLGGTPAALVQDGPNISITEAGSYTVRLFPTLNGGSFTIVKNTK